MEPKFRDGDILHVSPGCPVKDGDYVIASRDGGKPEALKKYVEVEGYGAWLKTTNPGNLINMKQSGYEIFGRVMGYTRDYR